MHERGVHNQRDAERDVHEAEPVQQEDTRAAASWCEPVEGQQEQHEPEDRVHGLDGELGGREEEGEEGDVAGDGQGSEGAKIPTVLECDEGEWDDDEQDGLLVDVPAEEERGVPAERNGADEAGPGGIEEELD